MTTSWGDDPDPVAGLEKLAAELDSRVYGASIVTGRGGPPYLKVTCRGTPVLGERIFAHKGYFWWSWAERIAPVTDLAAVAAAVARVLHATESQS
jgi:hypothetical protein